MPNRARNKTIKIRNQTLADLKRIYAAEWNKIDKDVEWLVDEMWIDPKKSTQAERLKHADKSNNREKLVSLIVAAAVLANSKAIKRINSGMGKIYTINADDVADYVLRQTGVELYTKDVDIKTLLGKYTKRRYNNAIDNKYVKRQIMKEIIDMLKRGEGTRKISQRLKKVYGFNRTSAFRTTLTESTRLQGMGRLHAMQDAEKRGMKFEKIWRHGIHVADPRDWHQALDGTAVNVDKPFLTAHGNYMMHPGDPDAPAEEVINCFVGETIIHSESPIKHSFKHLYSGELIKIITASGIEFTSTPNHPILTDKGWVACGELNKFDNLVVGTIGKNFVSRVNPNKNNVPVTMSDFHDFGDMMFSSKRIAGVNINFHGDIPDSDVEIKTSKGLLMNRIMSVIFKPFKRFNFKFANPTIEFLHTDSTVDKFTLGGRMRTPCYLSIFNKCFLFRIRKHIHSVYKSFLAITPFNVIGKQKIFNDTTIDIKLLRKTIFGLPRKIEFDNVLSIERLVLDNTHVYNLHTKNNLYLVNSISQNKQSSNSKGIIVHNCHCWLDESLSSW